EMGFTGRSNDAVHALIAADLAVTTRMRGHVPPGAAELDAAAMGLPPLGSVRICLYDAAAQKGEVIERLKCELRCAYRDGSVKTTTLPVDFRSRSTASASLARASGNRQEIWGRLAPVWYLSSRQE